MEAIGDVAAAGDGEGVGCDAAGVGEIAGQGVTGVKGETAAAVT